jgi:hypothetical protein
MRRYAGYLRHPELAYLFVEAGAWRLTVATLRNVPRIWRALVYARRMPARWAFWGYADHLDTPLVELRRRLAVRVV